MHKKFSYLLIVLFLFPALAFCQWQPKELAPKSVFLDSTNNDNLTFNANLIGFLKDNEYFSSIWQGATYPGVRFRPTIGYQIGDKFRADVGLYTLVYSGDKRYLSRYTLFPFIRLQYDINRNFTFLLGNYYGGINHQLIEPLYKWEDYLVTSPESGAQLYYKNKKYFADLWINWQQFIRRGDNFPEMLTFGLSSSIKLTPEHNPFEVKIPLQLLIHHRGGQLNTDDSKMIVSGNLATGVVTNYHIASGFIKSVGVDVYGVGYLDKLPDTSVRPYKNGWGIYPVAKVSSADFDFMAGYWRAKHFYSYTGEPLFASFNDFYPGETLPMRNVLTAKLAFGKRIYKMLTLGAQVETYTDLNKGWTDYSFGVHMRFDFETVLKHKAAKR